MRLSIWVGFIKYRLKMAYLIAYLIEDTKSSPTLYTANHEVFQDEPEAEERYDELINLIHPDGDKLYSIQLCLIINRKGPLNF